MRVQAEFVALRAGTAFPFRFCLLFAPNEAPRGLVVHVAPFAEELNKTRRMVSQQARRLAASGLAVLLPDLLGCGDSPGQLEDATWSEWREDVVASASWLRSQYPDTKPGLWLWGTRLGALLAAECAKDCLAQGLLLWQPVFDGGRHLRQFLRIADTRTGPIANTRPKPLHAAARLDAGETVDVAGYSMTPALAHGIRCAPVPQVGCKVVCVQQRGNGGDPHTPSASYSTMDTLAVAPSARVLEADGPAFWHQVEADDAADWWAVTTRAMAEAFA